MPKHKYIDGSEALRRALEEGGASELTRGEITAIASLRERDAHDNDRLVRNRVGQRIDRAVKKYQEGDEDGLNRLPSGRFLVDDVGRWLRRTASLELYSDIPRLPKTHKMSAHAQVSTKATLHTELSPTTLDRALAIIDEQRAEIEGLKREEELRIAEVYSRLGR